MLLLLMSVYAATFVVVVVIVVVHCCIPTAHSTISAHISLQHCQIANATIHAISELTVIAMHSNNNNNNKSHAPTITRCPIYTYSYYPPGNIAADGHACWSTYHMQFDNNNNNKECFQSTLQFQRFH